MSFASMRRVSFGLALFLMYAFRAEPQLAPGVLNESNGPGPALSGPGARVTWLSGLSRLSDPKREDDFPSVAAGPDGVIWAAWASYSGLYDEIHARALRNGAWSASFPVPGVTGDVWSPQVAVDSTGKPWFVWSQQVDYPSRDPERVNWDLFAVALEGSRWGKVERLTTEAGPDINPRLKRDSKGGLWLVWQGFRDGRSQIFLRHLDAGKWSAPLAISEGPNNGWYPDVAVNSQGMAWVVWDSYRNDRYEVLLRSFNQGQLGSIETLAASVESQANAAITIDRRDRPWIAWDMMGAGWGKDQGAANRDNAPGIMLNRKRQLKVVVRASQGVMEPVGQPQASMPPGSQNDNQLSRLYTDTQGRIWIEYRHQTQHAASWSRPWQVQTAQVQNMSGVRVFWQTCVTYYQGDAWIPVTLAPNSKDRISSYADLAPAPNGQMWMLWHTDNRPDDQVQIPVKNDIWAGALTPAIPAAEPKLRPLTAASAEQVKGGHVDEPGDVRRIRAHRVAIGRVEHRIVRGDLHRHTELSTDGGGRTDGSLVDFFRYMIDVADMDFGAVTDHNAGGDNEYWWWYINKLTDVYFVPGRYTSLFGYERSATFPNGHRNIIHPYRNIPIVKFHFRGDAPEHWSTYEAVSRDMVDNETKLLYDRIRRTGGIAISHTSATNMGTDWRDNDPELEPVVEIYQGARTNYEHEGAPRSAPKPAGQVPPESQYRPEGFVWNAWQKGYRLGVESSSDHNSTHMSYSMVVTANPTRTGVIDAIRKRHTYAATDNIVLEMWMGDHFMGDEFRAATPPPLKIKVLGTANVAKVSVIRNAKYIYEAKPGKREVSLEYRDAAPDPGTSYYYARIEQEDGQIAWASPIWVVR